ncbi:hypothetical protein V1264_008387 [Littorina saxatilis]|uniref:Uncharacterized protein n=1 Tax=Littorina saxatilis TaxID=31220 RepID=A0AAN9AT35_9CAEN
MEFKSQERLFFIQSGKDLSTGNSFDEEASLHLYESMSLPRMPASSLDKSFLSESWEDNVAEEEHLYEEMSFPGEVPSTVSSAPISLIDFNVDRELTLYEPVVPPRAKKHSRDVHICVENTRQEPAKSLPQSHLNDTIQYTELTFGDQESIVNPYSQENSFGDQGNVITKHSARDQENMANQHHQERCLGGSVSSTLQNYNLSSLSSVNLDFFYEIPLDDDFDEPGDHKYRKHSMLSGRGSEDGFSLYETFARKLSFYGRIPYERIGDGKDPRKQSSHHSDRSPYERYWKPLSKMSGRRKSQSTPDCSKNNHCRTSRDCGRNDDRSERHDCKKSKNGKNESCQRRNDRTKNNDHDEKKRNKRLIQASHPQTSSKEEQRPFMTSSSKKLFSSFSGSSLFAFNPRKTKMDVSDHSALQSKSSSIFYLENKSQNAVSYGSTSPLLTDSFMRCDQEQDNKTKKSSQAGMKGWRRQCMMATLLFFFVALLAVGVFALVKTYAYGTKGGLLASKLGKVQSLPRLHAG